MCVCVLADDLCALMFNLQSIACRQEKTNSLARVCVHYCIGCVCVCAIMRVHVRVYLRASHV